MSKQIFLFTLGDDAQFLLLVGAAYWQLVGVTDSNMDVQDWPASAVVQHGVLFFCRRRLGRDGRQGLALEIGEPTASFPEKQKSLSDIECVLVSACTGLLRQVTFNCTS